MTIPAIAPEVAHLSKAHFGKWFLPVFVDWVLIIAALYFALSIGTWWAYVLSIIVIGSRQHALGILGHEGAHGFVHNNLRMNDFLTNIFCLWPIGMHLRSYRSYHFKHHKNVGTVNDPELVSKFWGAPNWDLPLSKKRLLGYFLLDLSGLGVIVYKRSLVMYKIKTLFNKREITAVEQNAKKDTIINKLINSPQILFLAIMALGLVSVGLGFVIILWFVSLLTAGFAFFRLQVWTEHLGTFETNRIQANWWQAAIIFPHNTWYHYEHHKWTSVPHWNLPQARALDGDVEVVTVSDFFNSLSQTPRIESGALPDGQKPVGLTSI